MVYGLGHGIAERVVGILLGACLETTYGESCPAFATAHQVVVAFLNRKPFWFSISGLL